MRREDDVEKARLGVRKDLCAECSLALRRFIGHLEGVEEVGVEEGRLTISFDSQKIAEEDLLKISRESLEKLGYPVEDEGER
jgi:copper chaperone CopZ